MAIRDQKVLLRNQTASGGLPVFVHPLAVVEENVELGSGTRIWRFAHVRNGAVLGADCIVGNGAFVDTTVRIGNGVKIQNNALVYAGVTIEDEVFVGPCVAFTNDLLPRAANTEWQVTPTLVGHGASIGANSTIVCGVKIGMYALVAAGSVVTKDVPPFALVRGNPARIAGYVCQCGWKLGGEDIDRGVPHQCNSCGATIDLATNRILLPRKK